MFDHGCLVYFFFCPSPQGAAAPEAGAGARQIQKAGASAAAEGATVISVAAVGGSRGCCARAAPSHSASPSIPPPSRCRPLMATPPKRGRLEGRVKKIAVEGNIGESGGAPPPRLVPGGGFAFLRFCPQKRSRGAIASRGITRGEHRLLGTLRGG